jgi:hypothetical protein
MSTKITGFILDEGTDIFALGRKTRTEFLPRIQKTIYTEFLEHLMESYDMATYSPETNKTFRASNERETGEISFYHVIIAARTEQKKHMDEMPDLYQVQLGFMPDPLTGRILCAWFGSYENREIFDTFDEVEDFSYWNSSEGPDDISEEEWEARIQAWDRALLPSSNISSSALMSKVAAPHEMSANVSFDEMKEAGAVFPSREWRVNKLAKHLLVDEWIKEQEKPIDSFSGMMAAMRDETRIAKWTESVSERLPLEDIDFETVKDWAMSSHILT